MSSATPPPPPPIQGNPPVVYASPQYAEPPKKGGVAQKVLTGVLTSLFLMSILLNVYLILIVSAQVKSGLKETVYADGDSAGSDRIVIVDVKGVINDEMAEFVLESFDHLDEDLPGAVVLMVDSPGGSPTASDDIFRRIEKFKKDHSGIEVIASFDSVAASGGYYVAAGCDQIMAAETCITGSIGVIAQAFTMQGSLDKLGVSPEVLVADGSPDKDVANNTFREWNEADRDRLKMVLNMFYDQFVDRVTEGRGDALKGDVSDICDGDIYTAEQALANGLIDQIGYLDDAVELARTSGKLPADAQVTRLVQPTPLLNQIMGTRAADSGFEVGDLSSVGVRGILDDLTSPRILYIAPWRLD